MKNHTRALGAAVAALFFINNIVLANAVETGFWQDRHQRLARNERPVQLAGLPGSGDGLAAPERIFPLAIGSTSMLARSTSQRPNSKRLNASLENILSAIPLNAGTVKDVYASPQPAAPVVLLIQDVHLNSEAQGNLVRILSALNRAPEIKNAVVGIEAAFAPLNFDRFRAFQSKALVKAVADQMLAENKFAAPSYVGVTEPALNLRFVGVDDPARYDANVDAYRSSLAVRGRMASELEKENRALFDEKERTLSPALREFDQRKIDLRRGALGFGAYVRYLARASRDAGLLAVASEPVEATGAVGQFLTAYDIETSLDFLRAEQERARVVQLLADKLTKNEIEALVRIGQSYQSGHISFADYYRSIQALIARHGIPLASFPVFEKYIRYVLLSDGINVDALSAAVGHLEKNLLDRLCRNDAERGLMARSNSMSLVEKLTGFALTPDEWSEYRSARKNVTAAPRAITERLPVFERFYENADRRSESMVKNLAATLAGSEKQPVAALLTGGFHTAFLSDLLKRRGFSYAVVQPKITKIESGTGAEYLSVFAREKTPLDHLFEGEKLFLGPDFALGAPPSNPASTRPAVTRVTMLFLTTLIAASLLLGLTLPAEFANVAQMAGNGLVSFHGALFATMADHAPASFTALGTAAMGTFGTLLLLQKNASLLTRTRALAQRMLAPKIFFLGGPTSLVLALNINEPSWAVYVFDWVRSNPFLILGIAAAVVVVIALRSVMPDGRRPIETPAVEAGLVPRGTPATAADALKVMNQALSSADILRDSKNPDDPTAPDEMATLRSLQAIFDYLAKKNPSAGIEILSFDPKTQPAGTEIIRQGDTADQSVFFVAQGQLEARFAGGSAAAPSGVLLKKGALVGERAALQNEPRSATVVTKGTGPWKIVKIDGSLYKKIIEESKAAASALRGLAAERGGSAAEYRLLMNTIARMERDPLHDDDQLILLKTYASFFESASPTTQHEMLQVQKMNVGEKVTDEEVPSSDVFVILNGSVKCATLDRQSEKPKPLFEKFTGPVLGEMAFEAGGQRRFTTLVDSEEGATMLRIPGVFFGAMVTNTSSDKNSARHAYQRLIERRVMETLFTGDTQIEKVVTILTSGGFFGFIDSLPPEPRKVLEKKLGDFLRTRINGGALKSFSMGDKVEFESSSRQRLMHLILAGTSRLVSTEKTRRSLIPQIDGPTFDRGTLLGSADVAFSRSRGDEYRATEPLFTIALTEDDYLELLQITNWYSDLKQPVLPSDVRRMQQLGILRSFKGHDDLLFVVPKADRSDRIGLPFRGAPWVARYLPWVDRLLRRFVFDEAELRKKFVEPAALLPRGTIYFKEGGLWYSQQNILQTGIARTDANLPRVQNLIDIQAAPAQRGLPVQAWPFLTHLGAALTPTETYALARNMALLTPTEQGNTINLTDLYYIDFPEPLQLSERRATLDLRYVRGGRLETTSITIDLPQGILDPARVRAELGLDENALATFRIKVPTDTRVLRISKKAYRKEVNDSVVLSLDEPARRLRVSNYTVTTEDERKLKEAIVDAENVLNALYTGLAATPYTLLSFESRLELFGLLDSWIDQMGISKGPRVDALDMRKIGVLLTNYLEGQLASAPSEKAATANSLFEASPFYRGYRIELASQKEQAAKVRTEADKTRRTALEKASADFTDSVFTVAAFQQNNRRQVFNKIQEADLRDPDWRRVKHLYSSTVDDRLEEQRPTGIVSIPLAQHVEPARETDGPRILPTFTNFNHDFMIIPDLHEDIYGLLLMLRQTGWIDADGNLRKEMRGRTLVQMGDNINRNVSGKGLAVLELWKKLAEQAQALNNDTTDAAAQIEIVLLLGNHELDLLRWREKELNQNFPSAEARLVANRTRVLLRQLVKQDVLRISHYLGNPAHAGTPGDGALLVHAGILPGVLLKIKEDIRAVRARASNRRTDVTPVDIAAFLNEQLRAAVLDDKGQTGNEGTWNGKFEGYIFEKSAARGGQGTESGVIEADYGQWPNDLRAALKNISVPDASGRRLVDENDKPTMTPKDAATLLDDDVYEGLRMWVGHNFDGTNVRGIRLAHNSGVTVPNVLILDGGDHQVGQKNEEETRLFLVRRSGVLYQTYLESETRAQRPSSEQDHARWINALTDTSNDPSYAPYRASAKALLDENGNGVTDILFDQSLPERYEVEHYGDIYRKIAEGIDNTVNGPKVNARSIGVLLKHTHYGLPVSGAVNFGDNFVFALEGWFTVVDDAGRAVLDLDIPAMGAVGTGLMVSGFHHLNGGEKLTLRMSAGAKYLISNGVDDFKKAIRNTPGFGDFIQYQRPQLISAQYSLTPERGEILNSESGIPYFSIEDYRRLHPDPNANVDILATQAYLIRDAVGVIYTYHDLQHSINVAYMADQVARSLNMTPRERALFVFTALLHDIDPDRKPGMAARVPATLEWITRNSADLKTRFSNANPGLEKLSDQDIVVIKALIQRTEYPFNSLEYKRDLPIGPANGHPNEYYRTNGRDSVVDAYKQILNQIPTDKDGKALLRWTLTAGAVLSEYADKPSFYGLIGKSAVPFASSVARTLGLANELNGFKVMALGRAPDTTVMTLNAGAFIDNLGTPQMFTDDHAIASSYELDDFQVPPMADAYRLIPQVGATIRRNSTTFDAFYKYLTNRGYTDKSTTISPTDVKAAYLAGVAADPTPPMASPVTALAPASAINPWLIRNVLLRGPGYGGLYIALNLVWAGAERIVFNWAVQNAIGNSNLLAIIFGVLIVGGALFSLMHAAFDRATTGKFRLGVLGAAFSSVFVVAQFFIATQLNMSGPSLFFLATAISYVPQGVYDWVNVRSVARDVSALTGKQIALLRAAASDENKLALALNDMFPVAKLNLGAKTGEPVILSNKTLAALLLAAKSPQRAVSKASADDALQNLPGSKIVIEAADPRKTAFENAEITALGNLAGSQGKTIVMVNADVAARMNANSADADNRRVVFVANSGSAGRMMKALEDAAGKLDMKTTPLFVRADREAVTPAMISFFQTLETATNRSGLEVTVIIPTPYGTIALPTLVTNLSQILTNERVIEEMRGAMA